MGEIHPGCRAGGQSRLKCSGSCPVGACSRPLQPVRALHTCLMGVLCRSSLSTRIAEPETPGQCCRGWGWGRTQCKPCPTCAPTAPCPQAPLEHTGEGACVACPGGEGEEGAGACSRSVWMLLRAPEFLSGGMSVKPPFLPLALSFLWHARPQVSHEPLQCLTLVGPGPGPVTVVHTQ